MNFLSSKMTVWMLAFFLGVVSIVSSERILAEAENPEASVMSKFTSDMKDNAVVEEEVKHQVLFWMGVVLLVLILATAAVGINMAFFGKEMFLTHMVFAGATVFLSLAHAVTAIVWFFPYQLG